MDYGKEKDKEVLVITYRGSENLPIVGDMRLIPFATFHAEFHFELSHFEIDIENAVEG